MKIYALLVDGLGRIYIVNFKVNTFTNQNQSQYNGNVGWCDNLYHLSAYAGKTVTYSVDIDATNATSDNNAARIWAKDKEGNWKYLATTGTYINAGTSGRSSISVAITDDIDWIVFGLWLQTNATASNPMVELGSMATEYKDYEGTTIPVTFPATKNLFNPNAEFFSSSAYKWFRFINSDEICNMSFTLKDSSVDLTGLYIGFAYTTENIELGYRWVINNGVVQNYKKNIPSQDGDKRCQYIVYYPSANSTLETILSAYDIQVEQGSTATAYEPYGTIYGGYVDLVKGELVQTYYKLVADGVNLKVNSYYSNITDLIGGGIVYLNPVGMAAGASGPNGQPPNVFCDSIPLFTQSYVGFHPQEPPFATAVQGGKQYIIIYPAKLSDHPEVTDATTAKAFVNNWLQSNPVTIIYELVEPIIYQLTPTQLKSLKGTNNIWSNTNGNTTVTYWTH